ncbi:hypothetical protein LT966_21820 [Streptomyces griseobrunneus]
MKPFEPIGAEARWRTVYKLLTRQNVGDTVTYQQLADALDLHPKRDRTTIQAAVRRASQDFEERDKHALTAVANVGYRVVEAHEHLGLARKQQRKAGRALANGHSKVINVDFTGMDPEVRKAFEVTGRAFSLQMDFNRRFDVRQKRLESVVQETSQRTDRNEAEIAELKERLARLEVG